MDEIKVTTIPTPAEARMAIEREFFKDGASPEQIQLLTRIEEQLQAMWTAGYKAAEMVGETPWKNSACLGYAILGAKALKYKDDITKDLIQSIRYQFDVKSMDEATKIYNASPY